MVSRTPFSLFCLFLGCLWTLAPNFVRAEFKVPDLKRPVQDEAGVFSARTTDQLETLIRQFSSQGKAQIQVLTLNSLEGLAIEDASIKITDQWKLGNATKDNGILVLVAIQERKVRIEVGQGLEGDIPDVIASRIIRETMIPEFRQGSYENGIVKAVVRLMKQIDPEFLNQVAPEHRESVESRGGLKINGFVILIFILFILFGRIFGGRRMLGPRGPWGGGGFGGGFGRGGGFGGGGWGGGGGGFSGGGASGNW